MYSRIKETNVNTEVGYTIKGFVKSELIVPFFSLGHAI